MDLKTQEKRYHTYNQYLKERFHKKVFKVPLNGHFTCPNKDGTKGLKGCIYCSPSGSGDFAGDPLDDLKTQFQDGKTRLLKKWPDAYTIAYFQANTNTYKPEPVLRDLFFHSLKLDSSIVGLSIATRCDALNDEKIALLSELNKTTYLQVELGLQSIHEKTSTFINRGHDLACFENAVTKLRAAGIDVVVHIINGFPIETKADMIATTDYLNTLDIQGIKIHMLHVMKDTLLGYMYDKDPFELLSLEAYVDIVVTQIERMKPSIIIHRVTGDSPSDQLIAPEWTRKKFVVMNEIDKLMRKRDTYQGIDYQVHKNVLKKITQ
ncbi:MAG: TIGR01212 family radical SAM protein [Bacillota bacterium]